MLSHLGALCVFIGLVFGNILVPLIIWLVKKETMPFVDDQAKESLNFQISMTLYSVGCVVLAFVLIGIPLLILVGIADFVLTIIAAIKANDGEKYRYPFTIRLIQ